MRSADRPTTGPARRFYRSSAVPWNPSASTWRWPWYSSSGVEAQVALGDSRGWPLVSEAVVGGLVAASRLRCGDGGRRRSASASRRCSRWDRSPLCPPASSAWRGCARCTRWPCGRGRRWFLAGLVFFAVTDLVPYDQAAFRAAGDFTAAVLPGHGPAAEHRGQTGTGGCGSPSARATSHAGRRSSRSGRGSPGNCMTRSRTRSRGWSCRPAQAPGGRPRAPASTREVLSRIEGGASGPRRGAAARRGAARDDEPIRGTPAGLGESPTGRAAARVPGAGGPRRRRRGAELPVGIDLSAYRDRPGGPDQRLRHAGRARAAVHVHYGAEVARARDRRRRRGRRRTSRRRARAGRHARARGPLRRRAAAGRAAAADTRVRALLPTAMRR